MNDNTYCRYCLFFWSVLLSFTSSLADKGRSLGKGGSRSGSQGVDIHACVTVPPRFGRRLFLLFLEQSTSMFVSHLFYLKNISSPQPCV